jgi:hypothetical protein
MQDAINDAKDVVKKSRKVSWICQIC